jgi:preprotein translocase subunit SecD
VSILPKSLAVVPMLVCCGAFASARPDEKAPPKFEVRRAEAKPAEGLTEAAVAGTSEKVYLHKDVALTAKDVAGAAVTRDGAGNPAVGVTFTEEGTKKFAKLTEEHKGKRLAILVEGKVISAPVINDKVTGGKAMISGRFTKEEVEKLAKAISGK